MGLKSGSSDRAYACVKLLVQTAVPQKKKKKKSTGQQTFKISKVSLLFLSIKMNY
jgi:hypothetical protein